MNAEEFIYIQDKVLRLKGKDLADLIGAEPSSISGYRNGRTIPAYIHQAMEVHAAIALGKIKLPLGIDELFAISRAASASGLTLEEYVLKCLRGSAPATDYRNVPATASSRLNEEPAAAPKGPKSKPAA